jgi:TonB family protein
MGKCFNLVVIALVCLTSLAAAQDVSTTNSSGRKVIARVAPAYPELAKRMHIQGVVRVEAVVRANGSVKSTRVLGGNPVLIEAATDAVSKWKFEPEQNETTEVVQLTFIPQS